MPSPTQIRQSTQGWTYTLRRSSRAHRMRLQYCADRGLTLVLPRRMTIADAEAFMAAERAWIETCHRADATGLDKPRAVPTLPEVVELVSVSQLLAVQPSDDVVKIQRRVASRATDVLPVWVAQHSEKTGLIFSRVSVRNQRSRWGSYSGRGTVSLNWRLLLLPRPMVDYVILHELAHSRIMNHSAAFWSLLESICPGAREQDRDFDRRAAQMLPAWTRYWPP